MELRPYQLAGVDFLRGVGRCILADAMGVGKTPQLVRAAQGDTLVVAPPGLHTNWRGEIERWGTGDALFQISSYHSLCDPRIKDNTKAGHVRGVPKAHVKGPWDTVIFDEAHHLKGRHTGYAKAGALYIAPKSEQVFLATGTPIRNWAHEIYMLLRAIYPNDPRFSSYWRWVEQWFEVIEEVTYFKGRKQKHQKIGPLRKVTTWEMFIEQNGLEGRFLRRTFESPEVDVTLPPLQEIKVYCDMGPTQAKAYRTMEKKFFAEHAGQRLIALSHGSQWTNLLRLSSGLCFHPDFGVGPSAKLDALEELVEGAGSEQMILFAFFHETVEYLADWLGRSAVAVHGGLSARVQDRRREAFKRGDAQFLVGTYGVLSEGHNLTEASKSVLFEHPPVPSVVDQAMKRIHRIGQERKCTIWSLVTTDTVDSYYVDRLLPSKSAEATSFVKAADLHNYLGR